MRRAFLAAAALILLAAAAQAPAHTQVDPRLAKELGSNAPGSGDKVVPRYAGSFILAQTAKDFDELVLPLGKAIGASYASEPDKKLHFEKTETVEGRLTRTVYVIPEGRSTLEVLRNYTNDLEAKGAKTLFQCSKAECGEEFHKLQGVPRALKPQGTAYNRARLDLAGNVLEYVDPTADQRLWVGQLKRDNGGDVYISIYVATQTGGSNGDISSALKGRVLAMIDVLETKAMQQNLAFVSAEQIGGALGKDGRVALYGILFDFDKADIKPESDKQLAEMANLLKSQPSLKVFIVGHTDNKGTLAYNTDLSQRRAEAVAKALATKFGVAAERMTPRGVGPLSPLAPNDSEDGQAKNRRVELVKQ
jgi:outer membrane protein OmpA-like peptidoglycan-associated protein